VVAIFSPQNKESAGKGVWVKRFMDAVKYFFAKDGDSRGQAFNSMGGGSAKFAYVVICGEAHVIFQSLAKSGMKPSVGEGELITWLNGELVGGISRIGSGQFCTNWN